MQDQKNIIECYDKTAINYAEKFINELDNKHLDKILLKAFASENIARGALIDLGCGPGQTTKFLYDNGFVDTIGIDISTEMVKVARKLNPQLNFEVADMLNLEFNANSFGSAIAFYSIVHFDYGQVRSALEGIKKILNDNGQLLLAFHIGNKVVQLTEFLDHPVDIGFHFFDIMDITNILLETGLEIVDIVTRQPYKDVEHQSERAYVWVRKNAG